MDISEELKALIGCKVRFKNYDGVFEGLIKSVSLEMKRISFESVYCLSRKEYMGNVNLFFHEISAYSVLNKRCGAEKTFQYECSLDPNKIFSAENRCKNASIKHLKTNIKSRQSTIDQNRNSNEFVLNLPLKFRDLLSNDSVILDSIHKEFYLAIEHISRQSVIGVSFEGFKISRNGKLVWVCISTKYCVFLFDVQTLGIDAFDNGLRPIFQNNNIVKIIHDCRHPSDCLLHLFSTTIVNVFDTQVAEFIVNKLRYADKSSFNNVSSLDNCLVNYLSVPIEFLFNSKELLSSTETGNYFKRRPIDDECRNILIKNTLYLILLREKLTKLMMNSVYEASTIYSRILSQNQEIISDPSTIPFDVLKDGLQIAAFRNDCIKTSAPAITPKLKLYSRKANAGVEKRAERDVNETVTNSVGLWKGKSLPIKNLIQDDKWKIKSKQLINADSKAVINVPANDFRRNHAHVCINFMSDSNIYDDEVFKKSLNRTLCSKNSAGPNKNTVENPGLEYDTNKSFSKSIVKKKDLKYETQAKADICSKFELLKDWKDLNASSEVTNASVSDYKDTWEKLRSAFREHANVSNTSEYTKKNIRIVPSGMGC